MDMDMFKMSKRSKAHYTTLHIDLQRIIDEVLKVYDIAILCGHRSREDQDKAFAEGKSKLKFPDSSHNKFPSNAVDIAPYNNGVDWDDVEEFFYMAGIVMTIAKQLDIELEWGGRFKSLKDCPHFQLKNHNSLFNL